MVSNDVTKLYSISDLIELGKENSLNLDNTNISAMITTATNDIIYPIQNVFREDYRALILRYCKRITLDDTAFEYYKFRPKRLSKDLYGGVELWHLILWINDMTRVTDFNKKSFIVLNPDYIKVLNSILTLETDNMNRNKTQPIRTMKNSD